MPYKDPERRREYHREYLKKWDERNPEKRKAYQKCHDEKRRKTPKRQKQLADVRQRRHVRQRVRVIELYGGCCAFCGTDQFEHLTIDHIGGPGTGKTHRQEYIPKYRNMYDYLDRTEYRPDLYRLLCWNCHMGMTQYGIEPGGESLHDMDYWRNFGALRKRGKKPLSAGWKWITSDGQEFKSQLQAREALRENPDLRIFFSELSMAGEKKTDVTDQFRTTKE